MKVQNVLFMLLLAVMVVALGVGCGCSGDNSGDDDDGLPGGDGEDLSQQCSDLKTDAYDNCDGFLGVDVEKFDDMCQEFGQNETWQCFFACEDIYIGTNCEEFSQCLTDCESSTDDDDDDNDSDDDDDDDADDDDDDVADVCEDAAVVIYDLCGDQLFEHPRGNFITVCNLDPESEFMACIFSCTDEFDGDCEELGACLDDCETQGDDDDDDDDDVTECEEETVSSHFMYRNEGHGQYRDTPYTFTIDTSCGLHWDDENPSDLYAQPWPNYTGMDTQLIDFSVQFPQNGFAVNVRIAVEEEEGEKIQVFDLRGPTPTQIGEMHPYGGGMGEIDMLVLYDFQPL